MRELPYDINEKLRQRVQTKATKSDPRLSFWISRPTTQLTEAEFLECSAVQTGVSAASIAVRHMNFGNSSDVVYIGYIKNNNAYVSCSPCYTEISRHTWADTGFTEDASEIALAFDGTMPRDVHGNYEFITKNAPWVFWVSDGAVYGQILGQPSKVTLAESNVTKVSAVRAMWSDVPGFDFGLVLFMVINGAIHYRQLIDGVWSDAEPVPTSALPSGKTWTQISAQRSWDYRVALQLLAGDGSLYEMFTQFEGIGSKNAEHIGVKDVTSAGTLNAVSYENSREDEHFEVSVVTGPLYGGLYGLNTPSIISACNVNDGTGNYGKKAVFVFDAYLKPAEVSAQYSAFTIVDSYDTNFIASSAILLEDGKSVELAFTDFNNAYGQCIAKYTAGTVSSMADIAVPTAEKTFIPANLVPVVIPFPEVDSIWNE